MKEKGGRFKFNPFNKQSVERDEREPVPSHARQSEGERNIYDQEQNLTPEEASLHNNFTTEATNESNEPSLYNYETEQLENPKAETEEVSSTTHVDLSEPDSSEAILDQQDLSELTTHSEKDERIQKLQDYIEELKLENSIIPGLKADVASLKEEVQELKQPSEQHAATREIGAEDLTQMVYEGFTKLEKQFEGLSREFTSKVKQDESKEKVIDSLHRELQTYKEDQIKDIIKPVINDLILMADRTKKQVDRLSKEDELNPQKLLRALDDSVLDVDDILYRQGIESFTHTSETFDSKKQQIVKTIKTDDETKDKQIAEVVGKGYEWDGKVFRNEKVNVFVYEKPKNS
ncbi:nucleotide exchange factor GrpE [Pontibacillus sp. ALD_SL1]|uniref:nucleotide exchange factor GrpE n=1 Tax=Pontibacillus sp. ALD_SL1 TaxID=2777185 RepID=UPI001A96B734|nr:nucleotide exchange factor GrpE [Pontibacillus sp. ALD_SL1]QSS99710.1 nucleotide exchange factor GrpE [Pontibacillus sp. ALD_SL1]